MYEEQNFYYHFHAANDFSDVTDKVAQGAVVVNSGSTIVKASQGVTITKDFEVIPGVEFTITNQ